MDDHEVGRVATARLESSPRHGGARSAPIAFPEPPQQVAGRPAGGGAQERTGRPLPGTGAGARRPLRWVIAALVVLAIIGVVAWRALPTRVSATTVARRDVARTLVLTGRVRPPARPRLGTSVSGTVREVLVREGDHVSRGQLLVRIEDAQAAAALAQARAALATAEAQTRSTADQAELAFRQASRDLDRARALHAQGAISARDLETTERSAADARSQLDAARARTAGGATRLAEVARARAAVTEAEARLALTRVTAPAPATILSRAVELGDAVVAGQVLLELSLDGPTELAAHPREENVADLKTGASALASADAYPGRTFVARVSWLAPVVDRTQGTVETRFAVPDPPDYLRADMTVSINVEVERRAGAVVVSPDLVGDAKSAAPWVVVEREGRAARQPVRLGIVGDREVEILDGLAAGDRVLPAEIEPGRRVRVTGTATEASGSRVGPER